GRRGQIKRPGDHSEVDAFDLQRQPDPRAEDRIRIVPWIARYEVVRARHPLRRALADNIAEQAVCGHCQALLNPNEVGATSTRIDRLQLATARIQERESAACCPDGTRASVDQRLAHLRRGTRRTELRDRLS